MAAKAITIDPPAERSVEAKGPRESSESFDAFLGRIGLSMAFQPIVDLRSRKVEGFEGLSRFTAGRTDEIWLKARLFGFDAPLEVACIRAALGQMHLLPEDAYLSLNASPNVILSSEFASAFDGVDVSRIVIEITEEARVDDYDLLQASLAPLIRRGARLALDDVGSGFTGIAHILRLGPSIIKLDLSVTQNMDSDPRKKALAASLAEFGDKTNCKIVAEGIETKKEVGLLRNIGISTGQGYLFGKPAAVADIDTAQAKKYLKESLADLAFAWKRTITRRLVAIPTVALLVGSLLVGPAATAFAENAQPGETLWSAKLRMEDFRLAIEDTPSRRISLGMEFASRRVGELSTLLMENGGASRSVLVAQNFAKHVGSTVDEVRGLGAAGFHSRTVVLEAFNRHRQVLGSLVTLSCSETTPGRKANACPGLTHAVESSQKALEAIEQGDAGPAGNDQNGNAEGSGTQEQGANAGNRPGGASNSSSGASAPSGQASSKAEVPGEPDDNASQTRFGEAANASPTEPEGKGK